MRKTSDPLALVPAELFALLFIFSLVTASMRVQGYGLELNLLEAGNGAKVVRPENPHQLAISSDGALQLDGELIRIADLKHRIADSRPVQLYAEFSPTFSAALPELHRLSVPVLIAVKGGNPSAQKLSR